MTRRWTVALLVAAFSATNCGGEVESSLDVAEGIPDEPGSGMRRIRSRQMLRLSDFELPLFTEEGVAVDPNLTTWAAPAAWNAPGDSQVPFSADTGLFRILEAHCVAAEVARTPGRAMSLHIGDVCPNDMNTSRVCTSGYASDTCGCDEVSCELRFASCINNLLLEIAQSDGDVTVHEWAWNNGLEMEIPPQSESVRAALAEVVVHRLHSQASVYAQFGNLQRTHASCSAPAVVDRVFAANGATQLDQVFGLYAEQPELAREAAELAAASYRNVGTELRSANVSFSRGARESFEVALKGAELLVGRSPNEGVFTALSGSVCTQPPATGGTKAALDLLQRVALPPGRVLDDALSIDALIDGPGPSIKRRFLHLAGRGSEIDTMDAAGFLREVGLTEEAIDRARQIEAESIRMLRRDLEQEIGVIPGEDPAIDATRYAATATPPAPADPLEFGNVLSRLDWGAPSLISIQNAWLSRAQTLALSEGSGALGSQFRATRSQVGVSTQLNSYPGSGVSLSVNSPFGATFEVGEANDYSVVRGTASMRCAVDGTVEGQTCRWSEEVIEIPQSYADNSYISFTAPGPMMEEWIYVIKRESGTVRSPGGYRIVSAWFLPGGVTYFSESGLDAPEVKALAGRHIVPHSGDCSSSMNQCGEIQFDGRIPLEDELTDDGDAYESSWRRYLTLARAAANEADLLGEAALEAQLDIELRAEEAAAELETLCGVSINVAPLAEALAANPSGDPLELLESMSSAGDTSLRGLQQCLGASGTMRYTALGTHELCAWYPGPGRENELCGLPDGVTETSLDCPTRANDSDPDCANVPPGAVPVRIRDTGPESQPRDGVLGLFNPPAGFVPPTVPSPSLCNQIRTVSRIARAPHTIGRQFELGLRWEEMMSGEGASFFSSDSFEQHGRAVRWEARPGTHTALMAEDKPLLGTGDVLFVSDTGICGAEVPARCMLPDGSVDATSLFCERIDCASEHQRARTATRHARAAIVARWLGQQDLQGFTLPHAYESLPSKRTTWNSVAPTLALGSVSTTNANPRRTHYTFRGLAEPDRTRSAFLYARNDYRVGNRWSTYRTEPFITNYEDGTSVAFYDVTSEKPFGDEHGVPRRVRDANEFRAAEIANSIAVRLVTAQPNPDVENSDSMVNTVFCRDRDCEDDEEKMFSWVRAVPDADGVGSQIRRHAVRFFLDASDGMLPEDVVYDALELMCEASQLTSGQREIDISVVSSRESLEVAATQLEDAAAAVKYRAASMVLAGLPVQAYELTVGDTTVTQTDGLAGTTGAAVFRIKAALERIATVPSQIGNELDGLARDTRAVDLALRLADNNEDLVKAGFVRDVSTQVKNCVVETFRAVSTAAASSGSGNFGAGTVNAMAVATAAVVCADSTVQILQATRENRANLDNVDVARQDAFLEFEGATQTRADNLERLEADLRGAVLELQAAIAELDVLRGRARRLLSKALFLESDESGAVFRTNSFMRRRLSTEKERYRRARERAIGMTWLAKTAIEQRFGVRLADLEEDLTLVEAPQRWEATLCSLEGMDFDRILEGEELTDSTEAAYQYADEYIGEYVSKLELFVESYRLDYPFQNASDVAVISLRDDVANVRASCLAPVDNLLYHSNDLQQRPVGETPGWTLQGCAEELVEGEMEPAAGCYSVLPVEGVTWADGSNEFSGGPPQTGMIGFAQPFRVVAGCESTPCGYQAGATLGQTQQLAPGAYRLSWFALGGGLPVSVRLETGEVLAVYGSEDTYRYESAVGDYVQTAWTHYWIPFYVPSTQNVRVQITSPNTAATPAREDYFAGFMLESLREMPGVEVAPTSWASTGATLEYPQAVCEDTSGAEFRKTWTRNCASVCLGGSGEACTPARAEQSCFWETTVIISQDKIDRGEVFSHSGFADGNFNYRVNALGLNFVGTELRDCSLSPFPSSCYSGAYIPYSIEHTGAYTVRNHMGETYDAPLFTGVIEHARGLAAERYLTNPLSSTDRALIEPYMQRQFRGRPLAGTYRIRVWEVDGVDFDRTSDDPNAPGLLQDVQLVLDYGFWTRFN